MASFTPAFFLVVGVTCVGAGLLYFVRFADDLLTGLSSFWWPSVEGVILSSEVSYDDSTTGSPPPERYLVKLCYEYLVNERAYLSGTYQYGWSKIVLPEFEARDFAQRFEVGQMVRVYYAPATPAVSALKRGVNARGLGTLVGSAVCVGFGVILFWRTFGL